MLKIVKLTAFIVLAIAVMLVGYIIVSAYAVGEVAFDET